MGKNVLQVYIQLISGYVYSLPRTEQLLEQRDSGTEQTERK